ncbi:MAG: hypothetical protein II859_01260 [Bacteroidales bacterium]|nr:hypothetical protein [Bacteroidales bacterium]
MKKVLSVLCMALLAGGMIFTSCTKNFTITVNTNNDAWGTVTGAGSYAEGAEVVLTATAVPGYEFEKWQDGNTQNPRTITVSADETYTAYFKVAAPSVKVAFSGNNWDANTIDGRYFTDYGAWDIYSCKTTSSEYPKADVAAYAAAVGSYTDATADGQNYDNGVVAWVEYYNETTLQDQSGNYYGDWWAKSLNLNVSAFDATAMTMTSTANAVMFSAMEAFVNGTGFDAAPTANMTVNMSNIEMAAAKSSMKKISKNVVAVR